jgi:Predicted hydrolase of the metallo-beta-lactamase superfamily
VYAKGNNMTNVTDIIMRSDDSKVRVVIHRGTKSIGGWCTEVAYKGTRIAIDFGSPLPEEKALELTIPGFTDGKSSFDAALFTHYHGDHIGETGRINSDIPIYMSGFAKDIIVAYKEHNHHNYAEIDPEKIIELSVGEEIKIGTLTVQPILSDHSAAEALMYLIKADDFKILHTGDFRLHGRYKEKLLNSIKELGKIDLLITEGTTLSRKKDDMENYTEEVVEGKIRDAIYENNYCFFLLSSTNFDRFQGIKNSINNYRSDKAYNGKYFLIDGFQQKLFAIADQRLPERYHFGREVVYRSELYDKIKNKGFAMLLRAGNSAHEELLRKYLAECPDKTCLIYSMWSGYMEKGKLKELTDLAHEKNRLRIIHSSGHVTTQDLKEFIDMVAPEHVIVIHTESIENFEGLRNRIFVDDEEVLEFEVKEKRL